MPNKNTPWSAFIRDNYSVNVSRFGLEVLKKIA
jgi:hypothetical protein